MAKARINKNDKIVLVLDMEEALFISGVVGNHVVGQGKLRTINNSIYEALCKVLDWRDFPYVFGRSLRCDVVEKFEPFEDS